MVAADRAAAHADASNFSSADYLPGVLPCLTEEGMHGISQNRVLRAIKAFYGNFLVVVEKHGPIC